MMDTCIQEEIQTIIAMLEAEDHHSIRQLSEDQLISLHHGLGRMLRNSFRQNRYPCLFNYCRKHQPPDDPSFDASSEIAIKLLWEYLKNNETK